MRLPSQAMPHPWSDILRTLGRHALVAASILVVLLAPMGINCGPCVNADDSTATVTDVAGPVGLEDVAGNGLGDPTEPDQCDHCHCAAPKALTADNGLRLPALLVSRHTSVRTPDQAPDDLSFAPDPPPNKA